ncbi:hypothetical protein [Frankia sp. QA3]|uniref:hypothetical protein n=1 Tax=Frankia sp. QA3 TaxID=710111 RepID=UPI000269B8BD|nr:hypothetical protein [Frankia sp. QA3]EIV90826.1 hypothetical protein FraQA3DRAFT_0232 [Frankia sp. QA3]
MTGSRRRGASAAPRARRVLIAIDLVTYCLVVAITAVLAAILIGLIATGGGE